MPEISIQKRFIDQLVDQLTAALYDLLFLPAG
jgi:hypothetical protein